MLNRILDHIRNIPNNEASQCLIVRPIATSLILIYAWWIHPNDSTPFLITLYTFVVVNTINVFIVGWMLHKKNISPFRYALAIVTDSVALSYIIYINGEYGLALYPIYLWIAFGHGLRYGRYYLLACSAANVIGFTIVYQAQPYLNSHTYIFLWFTAGIIMLPLYGSMLYGSIYLKKLKSALEKSEAANEAKQLFLGKMSHELRTPLNGIMGANAILELSNKLDTDERKCIDIIHSCSQNLLELIDNVLDFTKLESGKIKVVYSAVNIVDLLEHTIQLFKNGQRISYTVLDKTLDYIVSDKTHLQHVLVNLISNALKFSKGGIIHITLSNNNNSLFIEIADNGCGIPEDQLDAIFEDFHQANNGYTRNYDGAGLGLSIAKQLLILLGGDIQVNSELNKGSIFTIKLPIQIERPTMNPKRTSIDFNLVET